MSSPDGQYVERVQQRCLVRFVNQLGKLFCGCRFLKRIGFAPLRLDSESLLKTAQRRCGKDVPPLDEGPLSPPGNEDTKEEKVMMKYREPLDLLVSELQKAKLTTVGTMFMHAWYSSILATRMQVVQYIRQNYFALQRVEIKAPLFVVGLPRCGTTITFNLLASDPSSRCAVNWQAQCPTLTEKQSKWQVGLGTAAANYMVPNLKTVHEFGIDEPEECVVFMGQALINYLFLVMVHMPGYWEYMFSKADVQGVYRWHKYILQILQQRYPEKDKNGADKRWVLKTPVHLAFIDTLLQIYPDARIVWNHRELTSAVTSTCSLLRHFQMLSQEELNLREIGNETIKGCSLWLNRAVEIRKKYEANFYDLQFEDLVRDPVMAMKQIYTRFEYPWTPEVEAAMKKTYKNMPRNKHGVHQYSMSQFDLNQARIEEACAPYYNYLRSLKAKSKIDTEAASDPTAPISLPLSSPFPPSSPASPISPVPPQPQFQSQTSSKSAYVPPALRARNAVKQEA